MATIIRETLPVVDVINQTMAERGYSNREVAKRLQVAPGTVGNWLEAKTKPDWRDEALRKRLAVFLGVSPLKVLQLFNIDVSDEVPTSDSIEESGG